MNVTTLRAATAEMTGYLSEVTEGDLTTPLSRPPWTIGSLIDHLVDQNRALAAAFADDAQPLETLEAAAPNLYGTGYDDVYRRSAQLVEEGFSSATDDQTVPIDGHTRTIVDAYDITLRDTVLYTWDIADALGLPYRPDATVAARVLLTVRTLPPSGTPANGSSLDTEAFDQVLALTGRTHAG